jgi:cobalt-zinc-cadmium efflux system outer membrane protein
MLASCSSLPRQDALGDTRRQTRARLGSSAMVPSSSVEATEAPRHVTALLKRPLTPDTAVQIALLNNRRLRASLEDVGIAYADLVEAATWSNPSLAASVRFPSGGGGTNHEFGLAADVLNWLLTPLRAKMAASELEKAKRLASHEILTLAADTKSAFYEAQAQEQLSGKLRTIAEVDRATADVARRLHDAGNINDLELLTQQTGLAQIQLDIKRTKTSSSNARAKLNRLMGLSGSDGHWTLSGGLPPLPSSDPSLNRTVDLALSQRQDLAAARENVAALEHALALKRKTRLIPGLNLGVDTEREVDGTHVTGPTLDVEIPLFNLGRASVKKLEAELRQAQANAEALEAEVRNDVEAAHATLLNARDSAAHLTGVLLPQRQRILKETLLHYNAMQKSNFELLSAKQEEQRAEQEQIEALRDYWIARADLEKATGGSLTPKSASKPATAGRAK